MPRAEADVSVPTDPTHVLDDPRDNPTPTSDSPCLTPAQVARIAANKEAAKQRRAIKKANLTIEMATNIAAKRQAARYRKAAKAAELAGLSPIDLHWPSACPAKTPPSTRPQVSRRWASAKPDASAQ